MQHRELIQQMLLEHGVLGCDQSTLTIKLRAHATAEMIREELERLHAKGLIQKFTKPSPKGGGPPKTIWRATTELEKDYYGV